MIRIGLYLISIFVQKWICEILFLRPKKKKSEILFSLDFDMTSIVPLL